VSHNSSMCSYCIIGVHHSSGAAVSPTLLSTERYTWLYSQHCKHTSSAIFAADLTHLMHIYHPRTKLLNPQGIVSKIANQWAITHNLASAIRVCFNTTFEFFASPLNSSMNPNVEYCTEFPEDANFGAHFNSFSYRLTGSCINQKICVRRFYTHLSRLQYPLAHL
jgi:hypothetical protein